jgi:hypothetical protein
MILAPIQGQNATIMSIQPIEGKGSTRKVG